MADVNKDKTVKKPDVVPTVKAKVDVPADLSVTENDRNSNLRDTKKVVANANATAGSTAKADKASKFNYVVAQALDGGPIRVFDNSGVVFWGTREDAEGLKKYAELRTHQPYEIYRIVK